MLIKKKKKEKAKGVRFPGVWCEDWTRNGRTRPKPTLLRKAFPLDRVPSSFSGQRGDPLSDKKRLITLRAAAGQVARLGRTMISSLLNLIISSYLLEARDALNLAANMQEETA